MKTRKVGLWHFTVLNPNCSDIVSYKYYFSTIFYARNLSLLDEICPKLLQNNPETDMFKAGTHITASWWILDEQAPFTPCPHLAVQSKTTLLIPCLLFFKFIHPNKHIAAPVFYTSKTSSLYFLFFIYLFIFIPHHQLKAVSHQLLTPQ